MVLHKFNNMLYERIMKLDEDKKYILGRGDPRQSIGVVLVPALGKIK